MLASVHAAKVSSAVFLIFDLIPNLQGYACLVGRSRDADNRSSDWPDRRRYECDAVSCEYLPARFKSVIGPRLLRFRFGFDKLARLSKQLRNVALLDGIAAFRDCLLVAVLSDEDAQRVFPRADPPEQPFGMPELPLPDMSLPEMGNMIPEMPEMPWTRTKSKRQSAPEELEEPEPESDGGMFGGFLGTFKSKARRASASPAASPRCLQCSQADAAINHLKAELEAVRSDKGQGSEEVDRLQQQVERLVREHAEDRSRSHETAEALNSRLSERDTEVESLTAKIVQLQSAVTDSERDSEALQLVSELKFETPEFDYQASQSMQAPDRRNDAGGQDAALFLELQEQCETLKGEKDAMVQAMVAGSGRVAELEKEMDANHKAVEKVQADLQEELSQKATLVDELRNELVKSQKDHSTLLAEREAETARIDALQQELDALRTEVERLQVCLPMDLN